MTAVKICGITRIEDAQVAAACGAHAIGLVFYGKSPRHVELQQAREIVDSLPPFVSAVGLFVNQGADEVKKVLAGVHLDLLQFHGEEDESFCAQFSFPFIKAARVRSGVDLVQYASAYPGAKGMLFDAYVEGMHGGTGNSFDWDLLPQGLNTPVILSGGLDPANVEQAIRRVRPWAVDVSSGVEAAKGIKDAAKIAAFMQGVRKADV